MDKNFSLSFNYVGGRLIAMDVLKGLDKKTNDFFDYIIKRTDNAYYFSALWKERVLEDLDISEGTYWRKLKKLVESDLLTRETGGVYKMNTAWLRIITKAEEEARKQRVNRGNK